MVIKDNSMYFFVVILLFAPIITALTPSTFLTASDQARLKNVLASSFPLTDLTTAHYAVLGYSLLKDKLPTTEDPCSFFNSKIDKKRLDTIFHATSGSKLVSGCKITVTGLQQVLESAITEDAAMQDIYHSALSLHNLNIKVNSAKVSKVLTAALKKDDSVINLAYAFHVASILQTDLTPFFERIEDVIVQADEVDSKYLQFEGGLGITATTISGIYKLAEVAKKAPPITAEQAVKFTNYFLSRKFVQTVKGSSQLLAIMRIFSTNKFHIPVAVTLASNSALSDENSNIQVRITNVLGASLGPLTVTADTAQRLDDNSVVLTKKAFQPVKGSDILYTLNFMEGAPIRGFYKILISAVPSKADPKLIGNTGAQINVKVMTDVTVEAAEIGTIYRDQGTSAKTTSIVYPKENVNLEADYHQKIFMKFSLRDQNAKTTLLAHQTFVQFINRENGQEVVFVAEPDSSNVYRFDLDLFTKAKEFSYMSEIYDIYLIVGDAVIKNPFMWKMGQVNIAFPVNPSPVKPTENPYLPKPEIKHLFREKEKRPSSFVSNTFSVLCLIPLLLLLILWIKLGVNLSNFPCSLYAPAFHLGLLGIFSLFICFWLHLNMFSTLLYLLGLGAFTFLSGHKLLNKLASSK